MRKNIIIIVVLCTALNMNAQKLRPFVGIGAFVHLYSFEKDLQSSPAINFSAGSEYRLLNFLLPEIEVNYMFGDFKDRANENRIADLIIGSNKSFSTVNFSFCPKIILGDSSDSAYIQILPKYTYSVINVEETNSTNSGIFQTKTERSLSVSQHNLGLGAGIVINFDTWYSNALAINLCYNSIRVSNAFDQLNPGTEKTDNMGVYGLELKYYFGVKRLK